MKKSLFFSKIRRSEASNGARLSQLRLETLEERQLLSVTDVAPIAFADAATNDAQYATVENAVDSAIDLGSVLNTTAVDDGFITQERLLANVTGNNTSFYGGFTFSYVKAGDNIRDLTVVSASESGMALKLGAFPRLQSLTANGLGLTSLVVRDNKLSSINCAYNSIKTIDLAGDGVTDALYITLDYDVETLYVNRERLVLAEPVKITLAIVGVQASGTSDINVQVVSQRDEYTPVVETDDDAYVATFNLKKLNKDEHDPIYVNVGVGQKTHTLKINPMLIPGETNEAVTAVVDYGKPFGDINLAYRKKVDGAFVPGEFSYKFYTVNAEGETIADVTGCFSVETTPYDDISSIPIGALNHLGTLVLTECSNDLAPNGETYHVVLEASCGNENESQMVYDSYKFDLKVNKAKLDKPIILAATTTVNSATFSWEGVEYASQYVIAYDGEEIPIDAKDADYITGADPNTGLPWYQFTATSLKPATEYTFTVTAKRQYMEDSKPGKVVIATLNPEIVVTRDDDGEINHNDDFEDGVPKHITLREAYDYVNRRYTGAVGEGVLNGWESVSENDYEINPETGAYVDNGTTRYVYKTIKFQNEANQVTLDFPIVSNKTFTINGVTENNGQVSVSGGLSTRIFEINAGTITAENLILTCGSAENGDGGAVYINPSDGKTAAYVANGGTFESNEATKYGGAVYVGANGTLIVNGATFKENTATRGGAIANFGETYINGTTSFRDNTATPLVKNATNGSFGGAIYNAGTLTIGSQTDATQKTTFTSNSATDLRTSGAPAVDAAGALKGYSGGAIYNKTGGTINVYNATFDGNFAGKYGGAVSNFGTFNATDATFKSNVAAAGGAVQTAGTATITSTKTDATIKMFEGNVAAMSNYSLGGEVDYGGNGGAIFASAASGSSGSESITLSGTITFYGNKAANAGGAIDYISGSLKFAGSGTITLSKNVAGTIGGAMVVGAEISDNDWGSETFIFGEEEEENGSGNVDATNTVFHRSISTGAFFRTTSENVTGWENVAVTTASGASAALAGKFGSENVADFVSYSEVKTNTLTYQDLARAISPTPRVIQAQIDGEGEFYYLSSDSSVAINLGTKTQCTVEYWDAEAASPTHYFANILVNSEASLKAELIALPSITNSTDNTPTTTYPAGIRIDVFNKTISKWAINWGDSSAQIETSKLGTTFADYHLYEAGRAYEVKLTAWANNDQTNELEKVFDNLPIGSITVPATTSSGAVLDAEVDFFADLDLVDELFEN
ncbi:MAG: hypothetical protein IJM54_03690 [Thermoguttaceae bacterium]|nr:hypothetical protein [Thermoguttaceae bacterium]